MSRPKSNYDTYDFANLRHIGPSRDEIQQMLRTINCSDIDTLISETVPSHIRQVQKLDWEALPEHTFLEYAKEIASQNQVLKSLIGRGYYGTITPSVIQRNILENPSWYTPYTPYQPEISQGRLEALLNFQTMVSDLTGLDIANASLLDEATACAEAMAMAWRVSKSKSNVFYVDENCHPQNIAVMQTRAIPLGIKIDIKDPDNFVAEGCFGAIFQYPGTFGLVNDYSEKISRLNNANAISVFATDLLALTKLKEPGAYGADIAVGSAQRFGISLGYGGPHAGFMACRNIYKRSMPGRLVGVSVDSSGKPALRLALQTREQHIRRQKATSNICTAQALLAIMASFYGIFHGPRGLRAIAEKIHKNTIYLATSLKNAGFEILSDQFFDTVVVNVKDAQSTIISAALAEGINLLPIGKNQIGISIDETVDENTITSLLKAFQVTPPSSEMVVNQVLSKGVLRTSSFMEHPVFNMNRSEFELMRYMRRLANRDLALDRTMIPLGSCTMKLNAAVEMVPISWPEFSSIHPFAPIDQAQGYQKIITELSQMLCQITGYDAFSMQPNSGAQGEFAGLLAIAAYHRSRGDKERNICLIPVSAHGTNPASAQMAGMEIVVVNSAENGDIDVDDFKKKAQSAGKKLAACMVTYPSTHGVFEETIRDICKITHLHGGQVYLDGANLNAMVGLSRPGDIGSDVSHLNLHKTFCIPHGGGGPGVGPIGVKSHLAPFLPGHPVTEKIDGAVSSAPFGSASILPISWAYCKIMGGSGLTQATKIAILNANYIAKRLSSGYKILYTGSNFRIAHECIIDLRSFERQCSVTVEDVAKRLIDYGFHAPTMSWPVAGTLMIEPTESESKSEIDRFINAMLAIREEIRDIEEGRISSNESPLKHAPHTVIDAIDNKWSRNYSIQTGCFPAGTNIQDKYWTPVSRLNNAYGDKNLVCSCPPITSYE